ncbi:MAG: conjugal transfer protein TraF [Gammaproteobacteria bacterium]|nr:conjugal transfer protein TraF [Gammaproteobacteria bacterium]
MSIYCNTNGINSYLTGRTLIAGSVLFLLCGQAQPLDFPLFDARTAGLAGASIAHNISNAAFYNPALAALEPENFEWYLLAPSVGEFISDPAEIENTLQQSGNVADIIDKEYKKYAYRAIQLTIPSPNLGGTLYVVEYESQTAKVDSTATNLIHRSLEVFEIGFGAAQLQDILWMEAVMVGITGKISLFESYGYSEPMAGASLELDSNQAVRDSELNLDFGISKEYGVWKTGLVFKNIFSQENSLGNTSETYSIGPQIRAAVAYQSRRTVFEFDIDLLKNQGVGFESDTMYAAAGWEWRIFPAFFLRLGYKQNIVGDAQGVVTGGVGLRLWALLLDVAASADEDGEGIFMHAAWEF